MMLITLSHPLIPLHSHGFPLDQPVREAQPNTMSFAQQLQSSFHSRRQCSILATAQGSIRRPLNSCSLCSEPQQ